eukprot:scaffold18.g1908.t1
MNGTSLPFLSAPHDAIRKGLVTLKDGAAAAHPVEVIQTTGRQAVERERLEMLKKVYGAALPARMAIERQMLSRVERLPGLPSSCVALESLTGKTACPQPCELDDFTPESYLSLPTESEVPQPDLHSCMEQRLGLQTKPCSRGIA